jgi:N-carbamoyl-L-amino-acid hydrolase
MIRIVDAQTPHGETGMSKQLAAAVEGQSDFAAGVFERLRAISADVRGVTRASYGEGEQAAHELMSAIAVDLGLEVSTDAAANTYMTLPGQDRSRPVRMVGSHLDSVPRGGNYDGAAGVVSGLTAICAMRALGEVPPCDVSVMGIRAEESCWFGASYIGSRSALGTLPEGTLSHARRADDGVPLAEHMARCGGDPQRLTTAAPHLDVSRIDAFFEPHIEQGPVLVEEGYPCGIVTGIRGNRRFPQARCTGEYAHCGGAPRRVRRDAVFAATELVQVLDRMWDEAERNGDDFACTVGMFATDAERHAMTIVPGEVRFSLDFRSVDPKFLARCEARVREHAATIAARRHVEIDLGTATRAAPGRMDPRLVEGFRHAAQQMEIPCMQITSGASHDAAAFADAGVPTSMLFIRNDHGSHNPDEAMALEDFIDTTKLLAAGLLAPRVRHHPSRA